MATVIRIESGVAEDIAEALQAAGGRGKYRVYREREQRDRDGRDWADYHGPARADERFPVCVTSDPVEAAEALLRVMQAASMGGFRYGRIERARDLQVATVSSRGNVILGYGVYLDWSGARPAYVGSRKLKAAVAA